MKTPHPLAMCMTLLLLAVLPVNAEYEIFTQRYSGDPSPYVAGGRMYITTSHDRANDTSWSMRDYNCLSSDDLVNWRDEGIVFSMDSVKWAKSAWAQQVVQVPNGSFVMAFPGMGGDFNWSYPGGVGIASSCSPAGPFVDQLGAAIMPGDDPTLFVDPATQEVHLCSNLNGPNCGILAADMKSWKLPPPNLPSWPQGSQKIAGSHPLFTKTGWHWYEGPYLYSIGDHYYLSFMMDQKCLGPHSPATLGPSSCPTGFCATLNCSWAHYGSDLGYAMSLSPVTNYTYKGSFMWAPPFNCGLSGLNNESVSLCNFTGGDNSHHGMAEFPAGSGRHYLTYHTRKLGAERGEYRGYQRNIGLDRLHVNRTDHSLLPVTATPSWLRPAKYLDPYARTAALTMAGASAGVASMPCADVETTPGAKRLSIGRTGRDSYVFVRHVDFGAGRGAAAVALRVATPLNGTSIEIRSGGPGPATGTKIADCKVPSSGGWQQWTTAICPIPDTLPLAGVHSSVYFVFRCPSCAGSEDSVVNFNFWQFQGGAASGLSPPATTVPVRIRARGAAGRYLTVASNGTVEATARVGTGAADFVLVDNEDGSWGLQVQMRAGARALHKLLCAQQPSGQLLASQPVGSREECVQFRMQPTVDSSWALRSYSTKLWLVSTPDGAVGTVAADPRGLRMDAGRFEIEELQAAAKKK